MRYKLHGGGKMHDGRKVYRIKALQDFGDVKEGDIGGYIESEANLSQREHDKAWVYDDSIVYGRGEVVNDGLVYKGAIVKDSRVENDSRVSHNAEVTNSRITNGSTVQDCKTFYAKIDNTTICHDTVIKNSSVSDSTIGNGVRIYNSKVVESDISNDTHISRGANVVGKSYTDGEIVTKDEVKDAPRLDLSDLEDLDDTIGLER